jgi:hypothetical protein
MRETFVDKGDSTCGRCGMGFHDGNMPHEVARRREEVGGVFDYPEDDPWHEGCIAESNSGAEDAEAEVGVDDDPLSGEEA